jgi:hypothetical protein
MIGMIWFILKNKWPIFTLFHMIKVKENRYMHTSVPNFICMWEYNWFLHSLLGNMKTLSSWWRIIIEFSCAQSQLQDLKELGLIQGKKTPKEPKKNKNK